MMSTLPSNRRNFLKTASAATLSALSAGSARQIVAADDKAKTPPATADAVIVLWMGGGMASTETFDPKRYSPYEKGMSPEKVLSTFPAIDTAVDHIKISKGLENIAKVMDRATLLRGYTAGDLGFILHSRHQYHWRTGYAPPLTVAAPHIGAVIARTLGPKNPAVPPFIDIGQRFNLGEGEELKAFHTAGFLGSEYGPFILPYPDQATGAVQPPPGVTSGRFDARYKASPRPAPSAATAAIIGRSRCAARWKTPTGCSARRPPRRSICRGNRRSRSTNTTRADDSDKAACSRGG